MKKLLLYCMILSLLLAGCAKDPSETAKSESAAATLPGINPVITEEAAASTSAQAVATSAQGTTSAAPTVPISDPLSPVQTTPESTAETNPTSSAPQKDYLIVIDPGHQAHANTGTEPVGPGSTEMKTKVSSGTAGVKSGVPEYVVNLQVALKLRDELVKRGYRVFMTRETHDVNISNVERAEMANERKADAFIRIHCNGSEDQSIHGCCAIIQTRNNPYNADLFDEFNKLSTYIVNAICDETGAQNRGCVGMDTMTGINWCRVPTSLVEMGFMSNPEEDLLLVDDAYQNKIVKGMADGLDKYFASK